MKYYNTSKNEWFYKLCVDFCDIFLEKAIDDRTKELKEKYEKLKKAYISINEKFNRVK